LRPLVRKLRQDAIRFVEQDDAGHAGAVAKAGEMRNDVVGGVARQPLTYYGPTDPKDTITRRFVAALGYVATKAESVKIYIL
jgi:hypothetical protein